MGRLRFTKPIEGEMKVIETRELEQLVRDTFPAKRLFCAKSELGIAPNRTPVVSFVHGGLDPFLDHHFEAWLEGLPRFVGVHQLLNRLCRAGALAPGNYAVVQRA
jgi:hypothetical protein